MTSNILGDRDTNTSMQNQASAAAASNPFMAKESGAENTKPKSMDYHRQMMEKKLKESEGYVFFFCLGQKQLS